MTEKQEKAVRAASRFLRNVYAEDVDVCAKILDAEAEALSGNVKMGAYIIANALRAVRVGAAELITEIERIKN